MREAAVKSKQPGLRKIRNRLALIISDVGTQVQFHQVISTGMNQLTLFFSPLLLYFANIYSLWRNTGLTWFRGRQEIFIDILTKVA